MNEQQVVVVANTTFEQAGVPYLSGGADCVGWNGRLAVLVGDVDPANELLVHVLLLTRPHLHIAGVTLQKTVRSIFTKIILIFCPN